MRKTTSWTAKTVYGALGVLLVLALWLLFRTQPVTVEIATITQGTFIEELHVDGVIKSRKKVTVLAFTTGDLGRVDLKVGELIEKGQPITMLTWDFKKEVPSPMTGVISKVYRESAGPIQRGEPIVDIIDPNDLEIIAEVLTTDAVRIPEGAFVKVMGFGGDETVKARVERISRAGFVKLSALGIEEEKTEVYVRFIEIPKKTIGDNFHVELAIDLFQQDNVLKIPLGALFKNGNSWAVYVIENKKAHLKNISISRKNDREAVLTEGLHEGESVILFPGDNISEGTRVALKK